MSPREVKTWNGRSADELRKRWDRESVRLYGSVTSTNDVARDLAEEDAPEGTVVLAREQTKGKGRAGKSWLSPAGGLYLSMIFRPGEAVNPDLLPLLAGMGIVRQVDVGFPELEPMLKWPNDLILDDRKAGGVLSEASRGERSIRFLVVGVGVNVGPLPDDAPPEIAERATSLEEVLGRKVDPVDVADAVIDGLEAFVPEAPARLSAQQLDLVDRYDWLQDRRVRVRLPDEEEPLPGVCVGIAPDGALLFRPDRGALRRLHSATIEAET